MTLDEKLERAIELMGHTHTVGDLIDAIGRGDMQGFTVGDSWAITEIHQFPRKRALYVTMVVGELEHIDALHSRVVSYAKETGCDLIRTFGRLGWKPTGDSFGWKQQASVWVLEL